MGFMCIACWLTQIPTISNWVCLNLLLKSCSYYVPTYIVVVVLQNKKNLKLLYRKLHPVRFFKIKRFSFLTSTSGNFFCKLQVMDVKKIPLGKMTENWGNIHFQYCIQTLAQAFFLFYEKAFCEFCCCCRWFFFSSVSFWNLVLT